MPERWRSELKRIDRLYPDDDLVERAIARPPRPVSPPRTPTKIAIIAFALILSGAASYGAFVLIGGKDRAKPAGQGGNDGLAATPTNGELLYTKHDGTGNWWLFALDPATNHERRITHGHRDYGSDWSPDSTKVVYDSKVEGTGGSKIVVANADGSNPVIVANGSDPAWSPDGSRIAYAGDGGRIWVMNTDGTDARPVTDGAAAGTGTGQNAAFDWNPAWSPDGHSIAFSRVVAHRAAPLPNSEGKTDVTLEQLRVWHDGAKPTETMLTEAYADIGELDWSPDASKIIFTGAPTLFYEKTTDGIAWPRVLVIPATGGEATPVSPDVKTWAEGATWSPDGRWIAYVDDYRSIVVMRPDGTERRRITIAPETSRIDLLEIVGLSWGAARR